MAAETALAEWRVACTTDGVKITSVALTSNGSVPPPQAKPSGSSFQKVLANASTEGNALPHSTNQGAKVSRAEEQSTRSDGETMSARVAARASGDTEVVDTEEGDVSGGERGDTLPGATDTISLPAAPATASPALLAGDAAGGIGTSPTIESSSDGRVLQGLSVASASDGGPGYCPITSADAVVASSAPLRAPGKADRPKTQAEQKNVGALTPAVVSVVDQSKVPVVNIVNGQVLAHGQGSDVPAKAGKNGASESFVGTQGKPRTSALGPPDENDIATIVASGTTGVQQDVSTQTPAQETVASLDASAPARLFGGMEPGSSADAVQALALPTQKGVASVDDSGGTKTGYGTSNTKNVTGNAAEGSQQPAANTPVAAQNVQSDSAKMAAGPGLAKFTETGTVQAQVQTVSHDGATLQRATSGAPAPAHSDKAENLPGAVKMAAGDTVASGINSAKLIQTIGETEMHVGMHSQEFGEISIRTSISQQQMVTQISLDHSDLSQAISTHLSAVQAKLGEEYGLHAWIEVNNQGAASSGGQGNSSQRDQQSFGRSSGGTMVVPAELHESSSSSVALASVGSGHGLDVRV